MNFGERIKSQREYLGITRDEFANMLNIKYPTLAKYETSERQPDFHTLTKISKILHVSIDFLLGNEQSTNSLSTEDEEFIREMKKMPKEQQIALKMLVLKKPAASELDNN